MEDLIRRVRRVAAGRPDPNRILAQTISMIGETGVDPYAALGMLIEGAVHTLNHHIPAERRADTAEELIQLLKERLTTHGLTGKNR